VNMFVGVASQGVDIQLDMFLFLKKAVDIQLGIFLEICMYCFCYCNVVVHKGLLDQQVHACFHRLKLVLASEPSHNLFLTKESKLAANLTGSDK